MRILLTTVLPLILTTGVAAQKGDFATFGVGCKGAAGVPAISSNGIPTIGSTFSMAVKNGRKDAKAFLIVGATNTNYKGLALPFNLGLIGAWGCKLYVGLSVLVPAKTDSNGTRTLSYPLPSSTNLIGSELYCQWVIDDPSANGMGLVTSNAARAVIGN